MKITSSRRSPEDTFERLLIHRGECVKASVQHRFHVPARLTYPAVAATMLRVFSPCLIINYGFSDDYPKLLSAVVSTVTFRQFGLSDGRILWAAVAEKVLHIVGSVENLRFVRALGVAGG